jgi:L-fuculose-phosphate aldolase
LADRRLLAAARALERDGLVVGSTGNVSVRDGERLRITPSRAPYARMRRRDLVTVSLDGDVLRGRRAPSIELPLHLALYRARADVGAVVHTHSVHAAAWSHLGRELPATEESDYYEIGPVRTSAPARAGSDGLAEAVMEVIGSSRAALIGGHGVVAVGPTLDDACAIARAVEHQATIAWLLRR